MKIKLNTWLSMICLAGLSFAAQAIGGAVDASIQQRLPILILVAKEDILRDPDPSSVFSAQSVKKNRIYFSHTKDKNAIESKVYDEGSKPTRISAMGLKGQGVERPVNKLKIFKRIFRLQFKTMEEAEASYAKWKEDPRIASVEYEMAKELQAVPNDTRFIEQWHLRNRRQGGTGYVGADISAPNAWDLHTGDSIIVAFMDTGVDYNHPDLKSVMWRNPGEIPGNSLDDDNNGYTDDVYGIGSGKNHNVDGDPIDLMGHGTQVAGTAAAAGNNALGVSGIGWNLRIMAVNLWNGVDEVEGFQYAMNHGARVINCSYVGVGGTGGSNYKQLIINEMYERGTLIVAAAGNDAQSIWPNYPAGFERVIGVIATDNSDQKASFSSYGPHLEVSAPGVNILTTTKGGGTGFVSGTSFASPLVAGVVGLILSANPSASIDRVVEILEQSTDDRGVPGKDDSFGYGRVNARRALEMALNTNSDKTLPTVAFSNRKEKDILTGTLPLIASASDDVGVARVDFFSDGEKIGTALSSPYQILWDSSQLRDGLHEIKAESFDTSGNNKAHSIVITTKNDLTLPAVRITAPTVSNTLSGYVTVTADASDNKGVQSVIVTVDGKSIGTDTQPPYALDWNTALFTNANHTVLAKSTDLSGNTNTVSIVVTVDNPDTLPPTINLASPSLGAVLAGTCPILVSAADNTVVSKVTYYRNQTLIGTATTAPWSLNWNTKLTTNGFYTLTAKAFDGANNSTISNAVNIQVNNVAGDTIKPTVSITAPVGRVNGTVLFQADAADNTGISYVHFWTNDGTFSAYDFTPPYSVLWDTTFSVNSQERPFPQLPIIQKIFAAASDLSGNLSTVYTYAGIHNVDTQPPTAAISAPLANQTVSGTVSIEGTASDNVRVFSVTAYVDGKALKTLSSAPYLWRWDSTSIAPGRHTVTLKATDRLGKIGTSPSVIVQVENPTDSTPPLVTLDSPIPGETVDGSFMMSARPSDNLSVANVKFYVESTLIGTASASPWSVRWDSTLFGDGHHTVIAKATDAAGNTAQDAVVVVITNVAVPAPTIVSRPASNDSAWQSPDDTALEAKPGVGENKAPTVNAGIMMSRMGSFPLRVNLTGLVFDDELPTPQKLTSEWTTVEGPGTVKFEDAHQGVTNASFSKPGNYVLKLTAHDGLLSATDNLKLFLQQEGSADTNPTKPAQNKLVNVIIPSQGKNQLTFDCDGAPLDIIDREARVVATLNLSDNSNHYLFNDRTKPPSGTYLAACSDDHKRNMKFPVVN